MEPAGFLTQPARESCFHGQAGFLDQFQSDVAISNLARDLHDLVYPPAYLLGLTLRKELLENSEALLKTADGHAKIMNRFGIAKPDCSMHLKCKPAQQHRAALQSVISHRHRDLLRTISRP